MARLYIISTPIGNLGDITYRAVAALGAVRRVLAEDTRRTSILLRHYDIETPMVSAHEHNEASRAEQIVGWLDAGEDLALVSDAGTPLLSDPGARIVQRVLAAGHDVVPIPGASALLAALVASGLDADRFTFFGFLPRKGKERSTLLDEIASSPRTAVVYEAPGRVAGTLLELAERAGERQAVVARELTKQFEELRRGTLATLGAYYSETPPRGEVVIVVAGAARLEPDESALRDEARDLRARGLSVRDVAAELAKRGAARNLAYRIASAAEMDGE